MKSDFSGEFGASDKNSLEAGHIEDLKKGRKENERIQTQVFPG